MIRFLPLFVLAAPAGAHPIGAAHLHDEGSLLLAGGIALIVTALGLALARAFK